MLPLSLNEANWQTNIQKRYTACGDYDVHDIQCLYLLLTFEADILKVRPRGVTRETDVMSLPLPRELKEDTG